MFILKVCRNYNGRDDAVLFPDVLPVDGLDN